MLKTLQNGPFPAMLWQGNDGFILSDGQRMIATDLDLTLEERLFPPTVDLDELAQKLYLLLITHGHEDHFSSETLRRLLKGRSCRFIIPESCREKAMDIEGLSENKLEKFIGCGFLHSYMDIYRLDEHEEKIIKLEGFGKKSWRNLWDAIQRSRDTTFERYLIAMDIPMIGNSASKTLARQFQSSLDAFEEAVVAGYDFTQLPDFGETLHQNIHNWFQSEDNWYIWYELREYVRIAPSAPSVPAVEAGSNPFVGKTVVVTGKVEPFSRGEINAKIEAMGAHAGSAVSSKTDYLVCGENAGSKLDKARQLGIPVLSPEEFFRMAKSA